MIHAKRPSVTAAVATAATIPASDRMMMVMRLGPKKLMNHSSLGDGRKTCKSLLNLKLETGNVWNDKTDLDTLSWPGKHDRTLNINLAKDNPVVQCNLPLSKLDIMPNHDTMVDSTTLTDFVEPDNVKSPPAYVQTYKRVICTQL